ncbi:hypothetical protein ACFMB7_26120 [Bacillus toyonensis]
MQWEECITTHYIIGWDPNLSEGTYLAKHVCQYVDEDFNVMQGWFPGVELPQQKINVGITSYPSESYCNAKTNGACWQSLTGPVSIVVPDSNEVYDEIRYLLAAEITEMFMQQQGRGWFGGNIVNGGNEGTVGEGLSIFLAQQLAIMRGLDLSEPYDNYNHADYVNEWLASSRPIEPQTLSFSDAQGPNGSQINLGFYLLFLYYLKDQLGYSINQIIAAAPPTSGPSAGKIAAVYQNLTGNATADPFPAFMQLINAYYPGTSTLPNGYYSPFPLPSRRYRPSTNSSISAVSRKDDTMEIWWIGADGSIQDAFWYEGQAAFNRYPLAPAGISIFKIHCVIYLMFQFFLTRSYF